MLGIVGLLVAPLIASTIAIVLGHVARRELRREPLLVGNGYALAGIILGWVGVVVFPQLVTRIGVSGSSLVLLGGLAYTVGALIYARRRPDPLPTVFGYHELFHAFVIVAVAAQYAAVAFFVLPKS